MRTLLTGSFLALAAICFAAEPEVVPGDLPRPQAVPPAQAVATCAVQPGFHLELMAAEPMVEGPVAMAFDEDSRLYVVEMRDYPEQREQKLGRVKLLEDTDGDGRYDRATIFAEDLPWPTGITCWDGGIFVLASPDLLYFKDTDGDGKADVHALTFTGFGNLVSKLNVQALPNSLQWGPDQRIHGALGGNAGSIRNFALFNAPKVELHGRDFSFDPNRMDLRAESGGGQYGMTFDDTGRKFVCSNSRHLMQIMYEERVASQVKDYPLPAPAIDIAADGPQAEVFRRSPDEAWRVIRTKWRVTGAVKGMIEGGGRASGYFTSASGVTIYRGDAWPASYRGDVFIADPGSNLIHHKKLRGDLVQVGKRAEGEGSSEFVASTDNWFRPVAFANAPDGNLWFADMYREVIEHPWSLPDSLKQHLDLTSGINRGRIYRIAVDGSTARKPTRISGASTSELVALLEHSNGWHRDTAARLLHQRQDAAAKPELLALLGKAGPRVQLRALHVLQGLRVLDDATLGGALKSPDADLRAGAVRLCAIAGSNAESVVSLANDPSPRVRNEVGWALVTLSPARKEESLAKLLENADAPWLRHSALAASGDLTEQVLAKLSVRNAGRAAEIRQLAGVKAGGPLILPAFGPLIPRADAISKFQPALTLTGDAEKGRLIFDSRCALCHQFGGRGAVVGPNLDAARLGGREKLMGNILEPSREITAGYNLGSVRTTAGATLTGVVEYETPAGVVLKTPGGIQTVVRRSEIAKVERQPRSLMPDGLEAGLVPQDMADLLEFLTANSDARVTRDNLLAFVDANGTQQPVRSPENWNARRSAILRTAQEIMGPLPGPERACPLDPQIVEESDCGTYVRRLLTYASEPNSRVPAFLLIPKRALSGGERLPAALCLHPTDNKLGHKVVVGLGGKENRQYAVELAERGFVTIAPAYPQLADYQPDLNALGYVSGTMKAIHDNRRALDLLDSLPFVRTGSYAAIGHSLGGHNSVYTALFDDRIRVVVSSCGLDSYRDYKGGDIRGWTSARYMPRLLQWKDRLAELPVDFPEFIAALAPRAVFISAPLHDDNFRADSVDRIANSARPIYQLLGAPANLVIEHPDAAHDFPDATREQACRFIESNLAIRKPRN